MEIYFDSMILNDLFGIRVRKKLLIKSSFFLYPAISVIIVAIEKKPNTNTVRAEKSSANAFLYFS